MKVLVCGSRDYPDIQDIELSVPWESVTELIEGGARGADRMSAVVARKHDIPVTEVPADWDTYGRSAGFIRNEQMLRENKPDKVYAFWDGKSRGTRHMIDKSIKALGEDNVIIIIATEEV